MMFKTLQKKMFEEEKRIGSNMAYKWIETYDDDRQEQQSFKDIF